MKAGTRCSSATAPTIPNALPTLSAAAGGIAPKRGSGRRSAIGPDLLWLVGAALFAGAAPVAAQAPKPDAELARAWAAGYRAAFTCSSLWNRSEEHTSELQSLMRLSSAVFCLTNNTQYGHRTHM